MLEPQGVVVAGGINATGSLVEMFGPNDTDWITYLRLLVENNAVNADAALHRLATLVGPGGRFPNVFDWNNFLQEIENNSPSARLRELASAYRVQRSVDRQEYADALTLVDAILLNNPEDELWLFCQGQKIASLLGLGDVNGARTSYNAIENRGRGIDSAAVGTLAFVIDIAESENSSTSYSMIQHAASASHDVNGRPRSYALEQNFPNPFNPITVIRYQLPEDNRVTIKLYDVLGKEVRTLVDEVKAAGY